MKLMTYLTFFSFISTAYAWGPTGHRVVGLIADKALNKTTKERLKAIMRQESLAQASNWADEQKSNPAMQKTRAWHYVNPPKNKTYKTMKKNPKGDIIWAINHFQKILKSKSSNKESKREAIRFLTHFIADLHQPLHVGFKKDRGGGTIKLKWFGKATTLHRVWDSDIINLEQLSFTELESFINHPTKSEIQAWQKGNVYTWLADSIELRKTAYKYPIKRARYWEYRYSYENKELIFSQLRKAGYRLAKLLEKTL